MSQFNKHPQHKYSKYIDTDFSYSNNVKSVDSIAHTKVSITDALKNMQCDGGIMLEPRLQEYLKKKKYYKDNNIEPCISLEKEFLITVRDKKFLKDFIRGRRDMYKKECHQLKNEKNSRYKPKQSFPSKQFRDNDSRVQKINKQTHDMPLNMGMFVPDKKNDRYYEGKVQNMDKIMDARDLKLQSDKSHNSRDLSTSNDSLDKYFTQKILGNSKEKCKLNKITEKDLFNNNEYGQFKNYDAMETHDYRYLDKDERRNNRKPDAIYGECDKPTFSEKSDMDFDTKVVMPNISSKNKRDLSTFDYRMNMYESNELDFRNTDLETNMVRGIPHHTTKSYGYKNPSEHYYQYIDSDFQNPDNSDLPFARGGDSTRRSNKGLSKQKYVRDIM